MSEILTVNLPDIGEGVVEGEVIAWLKAVGDDLAQDEPVVQVMTDKATVELPAVKPGKLAKQHVQVGVLAIKDKPLYDIEVSGSAKGEAPSKKEEKPAAKATPEKVEQPVPASKPQPPATGQKALASPSTRHYAREKGVNIHEVSATGKGGRVTRDDIDRHLAGGSSSMPIFGSARTSTPVFNFADDERVPLRGIRKIIAERMVESKHTIPHFAYFDEVDLTELVALRKELKEEAAAMGSKLTYLPFFVKAFSLAIPKFPQVNASLDLSTQEVVYHKVQHVGMAVATDNGLVVPVLRDVNKKSILELCVEIEDLAERTRNGQIKSEELKGSTITISNIGSIGGLFATPIINYPEVAILGMTRLQERAVVRQGQIVVRHMMNLAWCFDHRIVDGAVAAQFSNEIIRFLENPSRMLLGSR